MFLQVMNTEEKEKFLELIFKAANIEGEYADEEREIVDSYKNELGIQHILDTCDIDELIEYFSNKTPELKKIILFEIIGLINADKKVVKEEEEFLNKVVTSFNLGNDITNKIKLLVSKLQNIYDEIFNTLFD